MAAGEVAALDGHGKGDFFVDLGDSQGSDLGARDISQHIAGGGIGDGFGGTPDEIDGSLTEVAVLSTVDDDGRILDATDHGAPGVVGHFLGNFTDAAPDGYWRNHIYWS